MSTISRRGEGMYLLLVMAVLLRPPLTFQNFQGECQCQEGPQGPRVLDIINQNLDLKISKTLKAFLHYTYIFYIILCTEGHLGWNTTETLQLLKEITGCNGIKSNFLLQWQCFTEGISGNKANIFGSCTLVKGRLIGIF